MKNRHLILIHVFFWILAGSLNFAFLVFREGTTLHHYTQTGIKTLLEALDFYLVYLLVIPKFFHRKHMARFLVVAFLFLIIFTPVYLMANYFEIIVALLKEGRLPSKIMVISACYYTVLYAFLGGLFRLSIDGITSNQQKVVLEKLNAKNELAFLRAQINPHFLFNVLNTIHSYINSNNPNAAKAVIRLSDIMRYMLTDSSQDFIPLEQELEYLNSYIELQNYRIEKPQFVDFKVFGDVGGVLIPPLLLIPFVENAFKHGKKEGSTTGVSIRIEVSRQRFEFRIINVINPVREQLTDHGEQVGLSNVKRRLELLYPNRHSIKINTFDQQYIVELHLDLMA